MSWRDQSNVIGDNLLRLHPAPCPKEVQALYVIDDMTFHNFLDIDDMGNLDCCQAGHTESSANQAGLRFQTFRS